MIVSLLKRLIGGSRTPILIGSPEANVLVLKEIAKQGDDGLQERHVRHMAYPTRGTASIDRSQVVDLFTEVGLDASETIRDGVLGEHYAAVATPEFDNLTAALRDTLAEMNWDYDGWECAILKSK